MQCVRGEIIPASNAIHLFYKQIILQRGLSFEVKLHAARTTMYDF
jgi:antitoxin component of RelBE/YafQ-DinJ toxin-antitoxin module